MSDTHSTLLFVGDRSLDDVAGRLGELTGADVVAGRSWSGEPDGSVALVLPEGTAWVAAATLEDEAGLPLSRYNVTVDSTEPIARRIYDIVVEFTDWPVALYDERQPFFVGQRPATAVA